MAAPAVSSSDYVQKWNGATSFTGQGLKDVLDELTGIYLGKKSTFDSLPELTKWKWKYPAAVVKNRELDPLDPSLFNTHPIQKLKAEKGNAIVAVACNIPSLGYVAVFVIEKGYFELIKDKKDDWRLFVKNFVDCDEAHRMKKLLLDHNNPGKAAAGV